MIIATASSMPPSFYFYFADKIVFKKAASMITSRFDKTFSMRLRQSFQALRHARMLASYRH